jgi:hypothetical protein
MLTAAQREALEHVIEYVQETQMPISNLNEFDMQELRSLLTGSKPAWEVTEERIDGLLAIIGMLNTEVYDKSGPVFEEKNRLVRMLRAMLEEQ